MSNFLKDSFFIFLTEMQEAGIPEGVCHINTTEETEDGMRDVPCGRQSGRETAGLCE